MGKQKTLVTATIAALAAIMVTSYVIPTQSVLAFGDHRGDNNDNNRDNHDCDNHDDNNRDNHDCDNHDDNNRD
jgi:hypothetical protein